MDIVATFHTHPNTGSDYYQRPSDEDKAAVLYDLDLKEAYYEGEYIISAEKIYHISPHGDISVIGETDTILRGGV
jgi:hypothetical protein